MYQTPYIPDEDRIIREMAEAGATTVEVSKVLRSRSPEAIKNRGRRLGVSFQRIPEIDMEAFKRFMKGKK